MKKAIVLIVCTMLVACTAKEAKDNNLANNERLDFEAIRYLELDDGWVIELMLLYPDKNEKIYDLANLVAYNLKYKYLDTYSDAFYSNEKGEFILVNSTIPMLPPEEGELFDDIMYINNYLLEKQFKHRISIEDIIDYTGNFLTPENLIFMFNEAVMLEPYPLGDFKIYPHVNCKQLKTKMNEVFQVSYILRFGRLGFINIEYIDKNGIHLSDKVENGLASQIEIEAQTRIDQYESDLVEKNDLIDIPNFGMGEAFGAHVLEVINQTFDQGLVNLE